MRQPRQDQGLPATPARPPVIVRRQALADVPNVLRLRARSWRAAYADLVPAGYLESMEPGPSTIARDEDRFHESGQQVLRYVAAVDGSLAGFVVAGPDRDVGPPTGEIWAIYVDPDRWGSGIGKVLMATATEALRDAGHAPISLWVLEDNAAARGFYEHLGFCRSGERRYIDLGALLPEVRYILPGKAGH